MAAVPYPYLGVRPPLGTVGRRTAAGQCRPSHLRLVVGGDAPLAPGGPEVRALESDLVAPWRARAAARRRVIARRRRVTTALIAGSVLIGAWFGLGALTSLSHASALRLSGTTLVRGGQVYVVRPGDTLWSIAARLEPAGDPRPIVDQLSAEIGGKQLVAGTRLVLPG